MLIELLAGVYTANRSGEFANGIGSFDGHPWPWLSISGLRRQMANLHSFVVTGPSLALALAIHAERLAEDDLVLTGLMEVADARFLAIAGSVQQRRPRWMAGPPGDTLCRQLSCMRSVQT